MKKYVVAFINFFDNDLKIEFVEAENELIALYIGSTLFNWEMPNDIASIKDFKTECFNMDCMMDVKEIK